MVDHWKREITRLEGSSTTGGIHGMRKQWIPIGVLQKIERAADG